MSILPICSDRSSSLLGDMIWGESHETTHYLPVKYIGTGVAGRGKIRETKIYEEKVSILAWINTYKENKKMAYASCYICLNMHQIIWACLHQQSGTLTDDHSATPSAFAMLHQIRFDLDHLSTSPLVEDKTPDRESKKSTDIHCRVDCGWREYGWVSLTPEHSTLRTGDHTTKGC